MPISYEEQYKVAGETKVRNQLLLSKNAIHPILRAEQAWLVAQQAAHAASREGILR